jgi:hypothetical protein
MLRKLIQISGTDISGLATPDAKDVEFLRP